MYELGKLKQYGRRKNLCNTETTSRRDDGKNVSIAFKIAEALKINLD